MPTQNSNSLNNSLDNNLNNNLDNNNTAASAFTNNAAKSTNVHAGKEHPFDV